MTSQYVTVKKTNSDFNKYLWGDLGEASQTCAVPVKSYNIGTEEESVTFEIKKKSDITMPTRIQLWISLIKLKHFVLIVFPLFYILAVNQSGGTLHDPLSVSLAAASAFFLFAGLNIRNDVNDHVSGYDRVNLDISTKPIRAGWIAAKKAQSYSTTLIITAAVFALPAILMNLQLIYISIAALVLFFGGRMAQKNSYKQQHLGELILFLMAGPTLVIGYQLSTGSGLSAQVLSFGVLWGLAVLFLIQVNNFSHIMTSSQYRIKNTMTKLGFDLSQKFIVFCWSVFLAAWTLFHYFFHNNLIGWLGTLLLLAGSAYLFVQILNINSPMGSGLQKVRKKAYAVFLLMVCDLFIETVLQTQLSLF